MSSRYLSRAEVRTFDQHAIDVLGIPALVLMENAGRGAAQVLQSLGIHGAVAICCGKGNNGGDGLVMARHLRNWGIDVRVLLFARAQDLSEEAAVHWNITTKIKLAAEIWSDSRIERPKLAESLARADCIVDALFGTGLTGALRPPFDEIVEAINASGSRVFAVDIPSGLDCDTGLPLGPTIRADHTATFVAQKTGYQNPASQEHTGRVHVVDIGIFP